MDINNIIGSLEEIRDFLQSIGNSYSSAEALKRMAANKTGILDDIIDGIKTLEQSGNKQGDLL